MGGAHRPLKVDAEGQQFLRDTLAALPDSTLPELSAAYEEVFEIKVSPQTLSDTVRRMGYTKKKASSAQGLPNERTWSPLATTGKKSKRT
jgi:transposase